MKLEDLARGLNPRNTVLLFGAGSSIPSGAPAVSKIIERFSKKFGVPADGYTLSELSSLAEAKTSRRGVINELRSMCGDLKPTGGLKHLPRYGWKSIYTTNYDNLVEEAYKAHKKRLRVYHSNFSFTTGDELEDCVLFKIHGTIDRDICDGDNSRIILTEADYEQTETYREYLYDRLKGDLAGADLVIIGQSLADPDLKAIVNRAATLNAKVLSPARICLLMYTKDEDRASLFEQRGISVAFGGIDEFFAAMAPLLLAEPKVSEGEGPFAKAPALEPVTVEVSHAIGLSPDISAMFNGRAADYPEIEAGYTFKREVADSIIAYFDGDATLCATLLGASGVGKTTAARQVLHQMQRTGAECWEHKSDHVLNAAHWCKIAEDMKAKQTVGVLLVDDAHHHLQSVNELIDKLVQGDNAHLKILVCSSRSQWYPRIKTPNMYKYGQTFLLAKLTQQEIERLLTLLDMSNEVRTLVEDQFSGFNKQERRRRLTVRCESDMFVCLKNIFANDNFDDIMLREYADLNEPLRDIYRHVAALETAGVKVHRQLIIRLLGIDASHIESVLNDLTDIINEYTIDERKGIYGWQCRHQVIASIVTKYKFQDLERTIALFDSVIDNISPTYDIEIRSLRDMCSLDTGISRIPSKNEQNRLLRKMMSNAPGERVPRHRLIRNLIGQGHFEKAETEIRLFDKDFGSDGPVHRYKITLLVERAARSRGILDEDRIAILEQAHGLATSGVHRFPTNKNILSAYAELGIEYYKRTGSYDYFDEAMANLKVAEERLGDPQIGTMISHFSRRIAGQSAPEIEEREVIVITD
ncbi:SIR2 family protein [Mesorhizobium sp.]|uniref:SIR2 family NAD-dependent protein deacylase n=1 Tax=Mesorhizobium sp. TaxID=1871066 RepID=UPI001203EE91|nr:SIR2 family protein [Mesorhizobium sp.]TIX26089.1 MAG: hypothetical protein E5V35_11890 [Mesorhizobium sp.]